MEERFAPALRTLQKQGKVTRQDQKVASPGSPRHHLYCKNAKQICNADERNFDDVYRAAGAPLAAALNAVQIAEILIRDYL